MRYYILIYKGKFNAFYFKTPHLKLYYFFKKLDTIITF